MFEYMRTEYLDIKKLSNTTHITSRFRTRYFPTNALNYKNFWVIKNTLKM